MTSNDDAPNKRVNFTLRLSPAFHAKLAALAKRERRKLNDQLLLMLESKYEELTGEKLDDTEQPP